jgi:DNA repair protein RadC
VEITSRRTAIQYLRVIHGNPRIEVFRVLFLSKKWRLIEDKVMGEGTIDTCAVYPREIMRHALMIDAAKLILAHNHPGPGDIEPSSSDIVMTHRLQIAATALDIVIQDHVIIGTGVDYSMFDRGHMLDASNGFRGMIDAAREWTPQYASAQKAMLRVVYAKDET